MMVAAMLNEMILQSAFKFSLQEMNIPVGSQVCGKSHMTTVDAWESGKEIIPRLFSPAPSSKLKKTVLLPQDTPKAA